MRLMIIFLQLMLKAGRALGQFAHSYRDG